MKRHTTHGDKGGNIDGCRKYTILILLITNKLRQKPILMDIDLLVDSMDEKNKKTTYILVVLNILCIFADSNKL